MARRLVSLDRDGVINHDSHEFIKSPAEWRPIDGSIEAVANLSTAGFDVAVVTNQSGVGRGLLDVAALESIHEKMLRLASDAGGEIVYIAYCPHHPDDGCDCRKPGTLLFEKVSAELGVDLADVPMIGDSVRDIAAARAVGGRAILVLTGNGEDTAAAFAAANDSVETYPDLNAAVSFLIEESRDTSL